MSLRRHTVGRSPIWQICCAADRGTAKRAEYAGMEGELARAVRLLSYKTSQEPTVPSPESFGFKYVDQLHTYGLMRS